MNWIKDLDELKRSSTPCVLITITQTWGSTPCKSGTKMIVTEHGLYSGSIGGGRLELKVINDAQECLTTGVPKSEEYPLGAAFGQCCGGKVALFMEPLNTNPTLYIFGAGHVGIALANVMKNTVFRVQLIDSRDEWFSSLSVDDDIVCINEESVHFEELIKWGSSSYVVIMTHQHDLDQEIVEFSLKHSAAYVGLIGSQTKWNRFKHRIIQKNKTLETDLAGIHCPVGLDIGGQTPQEIAISIAAELLQTYYKNV